MKVSLSDWPMSSNEAVFLKVLQLSKTPPPSGDQIFNHMILWDILHSNHNNWEIKKAPKHYEKLHFYFFFIFFNFIFINKYVFIQIDSFPQTCLKKATEYFYKSKPFFPPFSFYQPFKSLVTLHCHRMTCLTTALQR